MLEVVALSLGQEARDGSQAPVLVRFVELGRRDALIVQEHLEVIELGLVLDSQVDEGRVMVSGATMGKRVLQGGVTGLDGLLRDGDVTP